MNYKEFLNNKTINTYNSGFKVKDSDLNPKMFDFQKYIVSLALYRGSSAIFADCGLGKTIMELDWAYNVVKYTNKPVLILTPLAVSYQMLREGKKFGIECTRSDNGNITSDIIVTNYERLKYFNSNDFAGVVCDESSILKSFDGAIKNSINGFMKRIKFRLLATATAAPNDYIELGTSSECLGNLGFMDMLNKYFKNDSNNSSIGRRYYGEAPKWRFKGHAELPFWRWVISWAIACRKPSDLGFDDKKFILPKLIERYHLVETNKKADDMLFNLPAYDLREQRQEKKRTIEDRCEKIYDLIGGDDKITMVWCHLNDEGDLLERMIPDSVQISGREKDEIKERKFLDFLNSEVRVLITKPKIGAWGLNFQHCNRITYFPSHSYEQYYQAVRRCWRFGQKKNVEVNVVHTVGEKRILENMRQKAKKADDMFANLINEVDNAINYKKVDIFKNKMECPKWL